MARRFLEAVQGAEREASTALKRDEEMEFAEWLSSLRRGRVHLPDLQLTVSAFLSFKQPLPLTGSEVVVGYQLSFPRSFIRQHYPVHLRQLPHSAGPVPAAEVCAGGIDDACPESPRP